MKAVAAVALAVSCCAGLPALVGLIGGLTLAGVVGLGAAVVVAAASAAWFVVRGRRRAS
jgi:hypothetical protein